MPCSHSCEHISGAAGCLEQMLLGLVAHEAGKKLDYDPAKGVVTNDSGASALLSGPIGPAGS